MVRHLAIWQKAWYACPSCYAAFWIKGILQGLDWSAWASTAGPFTWLNRNGASASRQNESGLDQQRAGNQLGAQHPGRLRAANSYGQSEAEAAAQQQQPGMQRSSNFRAFKSTDKGWQPKPLSQWRHQKPPVGMKEGSRTAPGDSGSSVGATAGAVRLRAPVAQQRAATENVPASAAQSSRAPRLR